MSDVPYELLREILSRLPVTPLLRFRSVSKSWKDLIDSQQFIQHHLIHSRKTNSNLNIVLKSRQLYSADFDLLIETNMATFKQLSHPLSTPSGFTQILGLCDGLLVLRNDKDDLTILWNPSVKRFHVIPCTTSFEIPEHYSKTTYHGFGYDVLSNGYKLIRITLFDRLDGKFNSEVQVYSLKSDSWRRIPDFPYELDDVMTTGVLANGSLHWIVYGDSDDSVVAFDLGTEDYRLVPLPKFADDDTIACFHVAVLGGCLSLMCYVDEFYVDLWVMKEYGVQESWSILFSYEVSDICGIMQPLAFSKCGRKVLLVVDGIVLQWYDLDKKSIDVPMVQMPSKKIDEMFTCLQSLVLSNNGAHDIDLVVETKRKRKDKKGCSRKRKHSRA